VRHLAALFVLAVGCGDDDARPDAATDAGAAPPDAPTIGDAGPPDAGFGPDDCDATWIETITGTIVDEAGAPVAGARPQACLRVSPGGALVCLLPPTAAADGTYVIEVGGFERCVGSAALRVLLPTSTLATTYCHLDVSATADGALALDEPTVLYATVPATTLPPLGDETVERTVVFDDGLELDVIPAELGFDVEYTDLRARRVPIDAAVPCFARDVPDLAGLYAFGDEGTVEDGTFAIRIPNASALPAGTTVELLVLGGLETVLADGTLVPEADLVPFGMATVSADGTTISSAPGSGLPHFTWLAYRPTK
jgi:hypothetical protein